MASANHLRTMHSNSAGMPFRIAQPGFDRGRRLSGGSLALERKSVQAPTSEAAAMNKSLLYVAPIALMGFMAAEPVAAPAALSSIGQNITAAAPEGAGAPLVLVRRGGGGRGGGGGGGGGGGFRGGGGRGGGGFAGAGGGGGRGGGSWAGAGRGNFAGGNRANFTGGNRANIGSGNRTFNQGNRNVNVSGNYGGYGGGYGWGGVAAGVAGGRGAGASRSRSCS